MTKDMTHGGSRAIRAVLKAFCPRLLEEGLCEAATCTPSEEVPCEALDSPSVQENKRNLKTAEIPANHEHGEGSQAEMESADFIPLNCSSSNGEGEWNWDNPNNPGKGNMTTEEVISMEEGMMRRVGYRGISNFSRRRKRGVVQYVDD
jgi:hypothetical protein